MIAAVLDYWFLVGLIAASALVAASTGRPPTGTGDDRG